MATPAENVKSTTSKEKTFARKAALALPSLSIKKLKKGDSLFIETMGEMVSKNKTDDTGKTQTDDKGKPIIITTVTVTDMSTGEAGEMVVPFIVKKAFDLVADRDKKLAGHRFELVKGNTVNRTNEWSVYELE